MSEKTFPLSKEQLEAVIAKYPTPFHIYDEKAIRNNIRKLQAAFSWAPKFQEHFAVKAAPNPRLIQVLAEEGAGSDCSRRSHLHPPDSPRHSKFSRPAGTARNKDRT